MRTTTTRGAQSPRTPRALDALIAKVKHIGEWCLYAILIRIALVYRRYLSGVKFAGVTGSCGKTTTKELIAAVMRSGGSGQQSPGNKNQPHHIATTILKLTPHDRFCVLEIGVGKRGEQHIFDRSLQLVRPDIAVVTIVGTDHISAFGSMEAIAAQKGKLVAALRPAGVAVLNADDALVLAMRERCAGRVLTYGVSHAAMVRAEDVRSSWPDRLTFIVRYEDEHHLVQTQLCGRLWVHSVLAALAAGVAMGVGLADGIKAVANIPPMPGRMSPEVRADGITFIRDDFKNPLWSIPAVFEFVKEARAQRKIMVIGTISDYKGEDATAVSVATQALAVADHVLFVGPKALKAMRAKTDPGDNRLHAFLSLDHASEELASLLRPGDLVLLKGTHKDRLHQLLSVTVKDTALSESSASFRRADVAAAPPAPVEQSFHPTVANCGIAGNGAPQPKRHLADHTKAQLQELEAERKSLRARMHGLYARRNALFKEIGAAKRKGEGGAVSELKSEAAALSAELEELKEQLEKIQGRIEGRPMVESTAPLAWVVGLGNPTDEFLSTPHNVGQVLVDFLARQLRGEWAQEDSSLVSRVSWNGMNVLLIKPVSPINSTGPVLFDLARRFHLRSHYCVLVHDDVAVPLGIVRTRSKGTDGGHRGVRSILECFETDAFARVKIGVGTPSRSQQEAYGVLSPFDASEMQAIERAYPVASTRIFEMLHMARATPSGRYAAGTAADD